MQQSHIASHTKTFSIYLDEEKGLDDALIQPYSGRDSRQSLEIYSKLSLGD